MATYLESFNGTATDQPWTTTRHTGGATPTGTGAWVVDQGTGRIVNGTAASYNRLDRDLGSADHYVEALINPGYTAGADPRTVLILRMDATTGQGLACSLNIAGGTLQFLNYPGGSTAPSPPSGVSAGTIPPGTIPANAPFVFRIEHQGDQARAFVNGTPIQTITSTYRTTGSRAGGGSQRGDTLRYDSIRAGALSDPALPVVDAGADASVTVGQAFARTAAESGGAPTSRAWTIVSGPSGAGSTLATTAALSWTPTAAGTYVLRYTATNSTGSASDDVQVTVTAASATPVLPTLVASYQAQGLGGALTTQVPSVRVGDTLLAIATDAYTATAQTISAAGLTWSPVGEALGDGGGEANQRMAAWSATAGTAGSFTVQAGAVDMSTLTVLHLRNVAAISATDHLVARNQNPAAAQAVGPLTVPSAGAMIVGAWAGIQFTGASSWSVPGSMTALTELAPNNFNTVRVATEQVTAGGAVSRTATASIAPAAGYAGKGIMITGKAPEVTRPQRVETYVAELTAAGTLTTASFRPRENELIVVKAAAGHSDVTLSAPTGGGLTFTEQVARRDANYSPVVISTAVVGANPAAMTVSVTASGSGTAQRGPTLIVERWANAAVTGTSGLAMQSGNPTAPAINLNPTASGLEYTWVSADWNAVTGAATYRGTSTPNHERRTASVINVWSAQSRVTGTPTAVGLDAPTGQKWTFAALELGTGPDPVDPPPASSAAERYGWGTPLSSSDEFDYTGAPDPTKWGVYDGPGHNNGNGPNGTRSPSQVTVQDGYLRIAGNATGDSGGLAHRTDLRFGRWEVRARFGPVTPGSAGESYHALLITWPNGSLPPPEWPQYGEYDWLEIEDVESTQLQAYLHYPHPNMPVEQERVTSPRVVDFTQWHNYAFEWVNGALRGFIDGDQWFQLDGSRLGPSGRRLDGMPSGHLTIQLDNFTGSSGLQPAYYDVEWARVYQVDGAGGVAFADTATVAATAPSPTPSAGARPGTAAVSSSAPPAGVSTSQRGPAETATAAASAVTPAGSVAAAAGTATVAASAVSASSSAAGVGRPPAADVGAAAVAPGARVSAVAQTATVAAAAAPPRPVAAPRADVASVAAAAEAPTVATRATPGTAAVTATAPAAGPAAAAQPGTAETSASAVAAGYSSPSSARPSAASAGVTAGDAVAGVRALAGTADASAVALAPTTATQGSPGAAEVAAAALPATAGAGAPTGAAGASADAVPPHGAVRAQAGTATAAATAAPVAVSTGVVRDLEHATAAAAALPVGALTGATAGTATVSASAEGPSARTEVRAATAAAAATATDPAAGLRPRAGTAAVTAAAPAPRAGTAAAADPAEVAAVARPVGIGTSLGRSPEVAQAAASAEPPAGHVVAVVSSASASASASAVPALPSVRAVAATATATAAAVAPSGAATATPAPASVTTSARTASVGAAAAPDPSTVTAAASPAAGGSAVRAGTASVAAVAHDGAVTVDAAPSPATVRASAGFALTGRELVAFGANVTADAVPPSAEAGARAAAASATAGACPAGSQVRAVAGTAKVTATAERATPSAAIVVGTAEVTADAVRPAPGVGARPAAAEASAEVVAPRGPSSWVLPYGVRADRVGDVHAVVEVV